MQQDHLNELKSACKKMAESVSDQQRLDNGETIWLAGSPARSDAGTISLYMGTNQTVTVKEKDILEVTKDEDLYFIKVRVGTELLNRVEIVKQVWPNLTNCNCKKGHKDDSEHLSATEKRAMVVIRKGCNECTMDYDCFTFIDKQGHFREVCIPIIRCVYTCI